MTYTKHDLLTGLFPYNIVEAPNGSIALTADNGNNGTSDGNVDTVSVIDLTEPVHVIDHISVPDSPEGLAFSPREISQWLLRRPAPITRRRISTITRMAW